MPIGIPLELKVPGPKFVGGSGLLLVDQEWVAARQ